MNCLDANFCQDSPESALNPFGTDSDRILGIHRKMSTLHDYPDNPTATYRGYRRQALYCLYRLFDDALPNNCVIIPEGNEDLEIRNSADEPLEIVQVKDYTDDLTVSALKATFYRVSALCRLHPSVKIKIVSFGPIGSELAKALDNSLETPARSLATLTKERDEVDSKGNKVTKPGLSEEQAREVFSRVEIVQVDEPTLTQYVIERLTATMTSGAPSVAFENLMWWLISSAEKQRRLSRALTIEKLIQMGRFLTYRAAHEHEWNISIKPIQPAAVCAEQREKLLIDFFRGGRVLPEHVAAGLDVPRNDSLIQIHNSFQQENVVILRAASGQGKTTLAYRYLLDWAAESFRFQIGQAADLQQALRMAAAIAGHSEVIDVPTIVYIDVRPGDSLWLEFVRGLASVNGVRVLVTIREEDWFRCRVSRDDFAFTDLSVEFTEETAQRIFTALRTNGYGAAQLNFQDAWSQLGDRKTLFEFVYLTTQNEQLAERIRNQIDALKDQVNSGELLAEELQLLRLVAVASAYESRIQLKALVDSLRIPEPTRTLERFRNEYLLRTSSDGKQIEGFHAIRSEIVARQLTDPVLNPRGDIEAELPRLLIEDDLESFLLCSFSRNQQSSAKVAEGLYRISLETWVGVRGVLIALQWLGLKRYSDSNAELIDEARGVWSTGWWLTLDWDLAQINGKKGFESFKNLFSGSDAGIASSEVVNAFQRRQTDKDEVFSFSKHWLCSFLLPTRQFTSVSECMALGEVLFWLNHLGQTNETVTNWFNESVLTKAFEILPIHLFAKFATGIQKFRPQAYQTWLSSNRSHVESRLREQTSIIALVEEDDCLVSHFAIDIDRKQSDLRREEEEASINDLSVQRVEIVAACLPGFARYGASGYGHQMSFFEEMSDDSIKRMPIEYLRKPWLPAFNSLARGVAEYRFRPESWAEYFSRIRSVREKIICALVDLKATVDTVRTKGVAILRDAEAWKECKRLVNEDVLLPKPAVDEWGFVTDSQSDKLSAAKARKLTSISVLDPFNRAFKEYARAISNFMHQSIQAMAIVPHLNSAATEAARGSILAKGKERGITEHTIRLSVVNGMDAGVAVRQLHGTEEALLQHGRTEFDSQFAATERETIHSMMVTWAMFCFPEQIAPKTLPQTKQKPRRKDRREHVEMRDCLRATINRIDHALKKLKQDGIIAKVLTEDVCWNEASALWISFDTRHPLGSFMAVEKLWFALVEAFRPDRDKIVRLKAIDWFWEKIVLLPLVKGRSIHREAHSNMKGASYPLDENSETQLWRFCLERIPDAAWNELNISVWEQQASWHVFDRFTASYSALFHHIDHVADFTRCKVDLDELGEKILQQYIHIESKRAEPFLQETFDSCAALCDQFPEIDESVVSDRPNIADCMRMIVQMRQCMMPTEDFCNSVSLPLDAMVDWRNRLKDGLQLLVGARALWIADSLCLDGVN